MCFLCVYRRFSVDQLLRTNSRDKSADSIRKKVLKAKELAHRMIPTISAKDLKTFQTIIDSHSYISEFLNTTLTRMRKDSFPIENIDEAPIEVDLMAAFHSVVDKDRNLFDQRRRKMSSGTYFSGYGAYSIYRWYTYVRTITLNWVWRSADQTFGEFYIFVKMRACIDDVMRNASENMEKENVTIADCAALSADEADYWDVRFTQHENVLSDVVSMKKYMQINIEKYKKALKFTFTDIDVKPGSYPGHNVCWNMLMSMDNSVYEIEYAVGNITMETTVVKAMELLEIVKTHYNLYNFTTTSSVKSRQDLCKWLRNSFSSPQPGWKSITELRGLYDGYADEVEAVEEALHVAIIKLEETNALQKEVS